MSIDVLVHSILLIKHISIKLCVASILNSYQWWCQLFKKKEMQIHVCQFETKYVSPKEKCQSWRTYVKSERIYGRPKESYIMSVWKKICLAERKYVSLKENMSGRKKVFHSLNIVSPAENMSVMQKICQSCRKYVSHEENISFLKENVSHKHMLGENSMSVLKKMCRSLNLIDCNTGVIVMKTSVFIILL